MYVRYFLFLLVISRSIILASASSNFFLLNFLHIVSLFLLSIFYQLVFHESCNKIFIETFVYKQI